MSKYFLKLLYIDNLNVLISQYIKLLVSERRSASRPAQREQQWSRSPANHALLEINDGQLAQPEQIRSSLSERMVDRLRHDSAKSSRGLSAIERDTPFGLLHTHEPIERERSLRASRRARLCHYGRRRVDRSMFVAY